ncbi:hypothetical protein TrVE_jg7981 [Triparma verrucosa]|uniref:PDZ domain-containing protein n=1 Tax=Triparma verrucosa TaxID=1606542 RepID=A0A9W7BF18_9STRA|nr:hypothetical protein TrVE_jg7981 [Triparma verrucosa]
MIPNSPSSSSSSSSSEEEDSDTMSDDEEVYPRPICAVGPYSDGFRRSDLIVSINGRMDYNGGGVFSVFGETRNDYLKLAGEEIEKVLDSYKSSGQLPSDPSKGVLIPLQVHLVPSTFLCDNSRDVEEALGMGLQSINVDWRREGGINWVGEDKEYGKVPFAEVTDVLPNSPASLSKILPNDYLISWDIFDINSLPQKFTLDDVLVSLNDVDRTEGIIVEVGRRRGGTSDNWKNITSTHVFIEAESLGPASIGKSFQSQTGLTLSLVPPLLDSRNGWDSRKVKQSYDPGFMTNLCASGHLNPKMSEYIAGVGWVGETDTAIAAHERREMFCTWCRRKGHREDHCFVKDPTLAKNKKQISKRIVKKIDARKRFEANERGRRDRERKERERYRQLHGNFPDEAGGKNAKVKIAADFTKESGVLLQNSGSHGNMMGKLARSTKLVGHASTKVDWGKLGQR